MGGCSLLRELHQAKSHLQQAGQAAHSRLGGLLQALTQQAGRAASAAAAACSS